jgi:hypothetical protein
VKLGLQYLSWLSLEGVSLQSAEGVIKGKTFQILAQQILGCPVSTGDGEEAIERRIWEMEGRL